MRKTCRILYFLPTRTFYIVYRKITIKSRIYRYFSISYIKIPVGRKYRIKHNFLNEANAEFVKAEQCALKHGKQFKRQILY